MENRIQEIREAVKRLFEEDTIDCFIGFEEGSLPLHATPCFIHSVEDIAKLTWNSMCENNLAVYVPKRKQRIGILAKGCDSRSLVELLKEGQVARENLVIIGIPCQGMVDRNKILENLEGKEALEIIEQGDTIVLKGHEFETTLTKNEILAENCATCRHRNPVLHDVLIGEPVKEQDEADEFARIKAFETRSADERWDYFSELAQKCIRCYACRNACPICFCEECCVDGTQPQWFGKSVALADTQVFHIMRAFHAAGRCVDCGACVKACPMDIDLRFLNKKVEKDVRELFSYEAGIDMEESAPLSTYSTDDYDDFIKS